MSLFDFSNDKAQGGFENIPAGTYQMAMDSIEVKDTKSGEGQYFNTKFKILEGEYKGRILFKIFNIVNPSAKAAEIGRGQFAGYLAESGAPTKFKDVNEVCGYPVFGIVKIKSDAQYGDKNEISYFKSLENVDAVITPPAKTAPAGVIKKTTDAKTAAKKNIFK